VCKHYPGRWARPYVCGMNVSTASNGIVTTDFNIEMAYVEGSAGKEVLGSKTYQVWAYSPVLSLLYGGGGTGEMPTNTKLGGLFVSQTDSSTFAVLGFPDFGRTLDAYSLASLYGSQDGGFATSVFVWASELSITLEAPSATASGVVAHGVLPIASLYNSGGPLSLSIQDLKKAVYKTSKLSTSTKIRVSAGVVNHDIIGRLSSNNATWEDLGSEVISYIIIEKAFTPINGAGVIPYVANISVSSNFAFFPKASDALARSVAIQSQEPM
jgi:hypothetical protein